MGRRYRDLAPAGVRPEEVTARVVLHLERFVEYLTATYGHDRLPGGAPGHVRLAGPPGGWPGPLHGDHHLAYPARRPVSQDGDWNAVQSPAVRAWEREHTLDAHDGKEVSSWSPEPNPFFDRD